MVASEQWRATGRPVTVEHPTIAATIQLLQKIDAGCSSAQGLQAVQRRTTVIDTRRNDQRLAGDLISIQYGGALRAEMTQQPDTPSFPCHTPPVNTWRTLNTAQASQGCQGSGVVLSS